jgi:hypothetical protein
MTQAVNIANLASTLNSTGQITANSIANNTITGTQLANSINLSSVSSITVTNTASQAIGTITYSSTITPDFSQYNNFTVTLTGNAVLANASNIVPGQSGVIYIAQDATGSRTMSYNTIWKFVGATAPTLSTAANTTDILVYTVQTTGRIDAILLNNFA